MSKQAPSAPRDRVGLLAEVVREVQLAWHLLRDPRVPLWTKLVPLLAVLYLIFPLDIISDLFAGLGQLDDLAVLVLGVELFISLSPAEVVEELKSRLRFGKAWEEARGAQVVDSSGRAVDEPGVKELEEGKRRE